MRAMRGSSFIPESMYAGGRRNPMAAPIVFQDGPQYLIEILATTPNRFAQDAFLPRAELAQRAVGASILEHDACLEAIGADRFECERSDEARHIHKRAGAANRRSERDFPLGRLERWIELPDSRQTDDAARGPERDGVGEREAGATLAQRAVEQQLDADFVHRVVDSEAAGIGERQQIDERAEVVARGLAQADEAAGQWRQIASPVGQSQFSGIRALKVPEGGYTTTAAWQYFSKDGAKLGTFHLRTALQAATP